MRWILALLCGGALVACNPVADAAKELNASGAPTGEFSGELLVLWLDDGDQNTGSGRFAFVPAPKARLSFTRPASTGYETAIRPERFYTDGGSVPRLAQVFRGFNPWAYGPAYAVHDWIFVANSCRKDGKATPEEAKHAEMDFDDSQQIMLETIATLMENGAVTENNFSRSIITLAVGSPISRSLWEAEDTCDQRRLSFAHNCRVDRVLDLPLDPDCPSIPKRIEDQDRIVTRVSF